MVRAFNIFHLKMWAVTHIKLLTYNIYANGSSITCSTVLKHLFKAWCDWHPDDSNTAHTRQAEKSGMRFDCLFWPSTRWGNNHFVLVAELRSLLLWCFLLRLVPRVWLWHEANAWAYNVNKHLHCRRTFIEWLPSFLVQVRNAVQDWPQGVNGKTKKRSHAPVPLTAAFPLWTCQRKLPRSHMHFLLYDVATMLTVLLC